MKVRAESNVNIKAHSFSEITFPVRHELSGEKEDVATNKNFSDLIRKGKNYQ